MYLQNVLRDAFSKTIYPFNSITANITDNHFQHTNARTTNRFRRKFALAYNINFNKISPMLPPNDPR